MLESRCRAVRYPFIERLASAVARGVACTVALGVGVGLAQPALATDVLVLSAVSDGVSSTDASMIARLRQHGFTVNTSLMGREVQRLAFDADLITALNETAAVVIGAQAPALTVDGSLSACSALGEHEYIAPMTELLRDAARPVIEFTSLVPINLPQQIEAAIASRVWPDVAFAVRPNADLNRNGVYDVDDVTLLTQLIGQPDADPRGDLDGDGAVSLHDLETLIGSYWNSVLGDANLNGDFGTDDLITVFQAGKYETGELADWSAGDWNADRQFNSSDLVAAIIAASGYCPGPRLSVPIPEPATWVEMLVAWPLVARFVGRARG